MKRSRFVVALLAATMVLGSFSPASASSAREKVAAQRAAVEAKIACMRSPSNCGSAPAPTAVTTAPVRTQAPKESVKPSGGAKAIEISIANQTLTAWEGNRAVLVLAVSTGGPGNETPTGRFSIQSKETNHWSTQYSVNMPYAMRVVNGIFIHELPITPDGRRLGAGSLGSAVSHGCIRVGVGDAQALFNWTPVGTPVIIH